jgi:hypothetical protein
MEMNVAQGGLFSPLQNLASVNKQGNILISTDDLKIVKEVTNVLESEIKNLMSDIGKLSAYQESLKVHSQHHDVEDDSSGDEDNYVTRHKNTALSPPSVKIDRIGLAAQLRYLADVLESSKDMQEYFEKFDVKPKL